MKGRTILKAAISIFVGTGLPQRRYGRGVAGSGPILQNIAGTPAAKDGSWEPSKWGVLAVVLAGFTALCLGQYRLETPRRGGLRASASKTIQLPTPKLTGSVSFEQALVNQHDVRPFTGQPLKFTDVGQLAWAGQGVTKPQEGFEMATSAEEIYPIKLYFVTQDGIYLYNPDEHSLKQTFDQDVRSGLVTATLNQRGEAVTGCDIILAGSVRSLTARYGNKTRRLMLMQAGQIAQNIQLQAVSLELGFVPITNFDTNSVRRACKLPRNLELLYIISVGYPVGQTPATDEEQKSTGARKAVLIVARENFRDEELFETRRVLDMAGVQTVIASTRIGIVRGMLGNATEARILVNQLRVYDYDAIVFIGGLGAVEYFDNPVALSIAREAVVRGKFLAAISTAPTVLANAGVLNGVRATSFLSERNRLIQAGAIYTGAPVEWDRLIITSSGPLAAGQFGRAIADALAGR